jgi:diguanylate cyclase (GGDEF)-like protein/PAS domain S-box-containing protein
VGKGEHSSSENTFQELAAYSSDMIAIVNDQAEIVYANPTVARLLGCSTKEAIGRNIWDLIHPADCGRAVEAFTRDLSEPGVHPPSIYRLKTASGDWRFIEGTVTNCLHVPAIGGIVVNCRDVTDVTNLTRALRTVSQASQVLLNTTDELSLLGAICRTVVEDGGYLLAWVGYVEHDEERTVRPVAWAGESAYLQEVHVTSAEADDGNGSIGVAIRRGTLEVVDDLRDAHASTERTAAAKYGLRTSCAVPLQVGSEVIGALSIYSAEANTFGSAEIELFTELGAALSFGIKRIRDASSLKASEERFQILAATAPIGILEVSADASIRYANPKIAEISGREIETLMGGGWMDFIHAEDAPALLALVDGIGPDSATVVTRFRITRPDGEIRHVEMSVAPQRQDLNTEYVVTVDDITVEVDSQEKLAHQAFYDTLTGLPNRALFLDRLNQELARTRRDGSNIAVLFLDLDRFKTVNDSLGHEVGDAVLREVGGRFAQVVRTGETAARFGGDEFIFLIHNVHGPEDAIAMAERILETLESPIRCAGQDLITAASIGIVIVPPDANGTTILRDADTAMYRAKSASPNRYALFNDELHRHSVRRLEIENDLRHALARQEFDVHYEPVVVTTNGLPFAAEALIRWHHPTGKLVQPLDFIPMAEESGLIKPIGRWVFEQAISQLAAWDAQEDGPRLEVLAVNLSARQLEDPETADAVRDVISRYGIAPGRVALEVTESTAMAPDGSSGKSLEVFRELGLRVAIDDFGTGYSSLAQLHTLPVTTVKIDRSFIERLGSPDDSSPVVKAIIAMCHTMGLRVVAEGVSDERLWTLVSAMGCDLAQGYYWSRALPAKAFANWWRMAEKGAHDLPIVSIGSALHSSRHLSPRAIHGSPRPKHVGGSNDDGSRLAGSTGFE